MILKFLHATAEARTASSCRVSQWIGIGIIGVLFVGLPISSSAQLKITLKSDLEDGKSVAFNAETTVRRGGDDILLEIHSISIRGGTDADSRYLLGIEAYVSDVATNAILGKSTTTYTRTIAVLDPKTYMVLKDIDFRIPLSETKNELRVVVVVNTRLGYTDRPYGWYGGANIARADLMCPNVLDIKDGNGRSVKFDVRTYVASKSSLAVAIQEVEHRLREAPRNSATSSPLQQGYISILKALECRK